MSALDRCFRQGLWLVQKDLRREFRSKHIVPRMLLLGMTLSFLLAYQSSRSGSSADTAAGHCWMTLCVMAIVSLGSAVHQDHEHGCWNVLRLSPVPTPVLYLSKVAFNSLLFGFAQLVVVPLFVVFSDAPWHTHAWELSAVLLLGNLGVASIGTLLGAVSAATEQGDGLLSILLLPLLAPVMLASSEATRLLAENLLPVEWFRWLQLLGACAIVYLTAGCVLYDFVREDDC